MSYRQRELVMGFLGFVVLMIGMVAVGQIWPGLYDAGAPPTTERPRNTAID